jgi:hypothetical protein
MANMTDSCNKEKACQENITFMALSCGLAPDIAQSLIIGSHYAKRIYVNSIIEHFLDDSDQTILPKKVGDILERERTKLFFNI